MIVTRISPVTKKMNSMEINITEAQLKLWEDGYLIQTVMPNISADEREFIMTGMVAEDFDYIFNLDSEDWD